MSFGPSAIAAGLLSFAICQSALAGGPTDPDAAPDVIATAPPADWSGLYFGAALATPRGDNTWRQASDGLELVPGSWTGSLMVLSVGRDWQKERLTYGAQLSYGNGDFSASPTSATFISCSICATEVSNLITLRGRVGIAAGQMRFFAAGGLAHANVTATNLSGLIVVREAALTGWTAGIGVERLIGENLSLAVSYDHVDLGALDLPTYLPTGETEVDFGMMQVGMNVRW
jgi:opacity protein-like surface antigen